MNKSIKNITADSFKKYGYVIEHNTNIPENFQIVLNEFAEVGWRIAVSKIVDKAIGKVARHPNSMETFEPVAGVTLICVAAPETPEEYEIFLLDKPVCLHKNVWHANCTMSPYSIVKICENAYVDSEEYKYAKELAIGII
ncbi:MAG: hypothetical protein SCK28_04255 [Bacillota bacterium]|nr:hypothetical protein [Bacillota bacterium]